MAAGLQIGDMPSNASIGVAAVAVAAGCGARTRCIRRPLAHSTEAATIVLGEHVVLVLVLLPVVLAALPALWRAGPRFVAAGIVVGAGSSALATILFTQAFVQGDPVTPVVLQNVQPLIAVSLAAALLGERPRARFGLFLLGGLVGTWLMAFPSPFDVSLHGLAPVLYALGGGRPLGARHRARPLPLARAAFRASDRRPLRVRAAGRAGRGARPGRAATASLHDELFIALLAIVTGLVALLLYYWGLKRTTASVASLAELTFPVVAIAVGYFAFDATLTSTQLAGVALTSLVVLGLPAALPALVREPAHAAPVLSGQRALAPRQRPRAARRSGTARARDADSVPGCR